MELTVGFVKNSLELVLNSGAGDVGRPSRSGLRAAFPVLTTFSDLGDHEFWIHTYVTFTLSMERELYLPLVML